MIKFYTLNHNIKFIFILIRLLVFLSYFNLLFFISSSFANNNNYEKSLRKNSDDLNSNSLSKINLSLVNLEKIFKEKNRELKIYESRIDQSSRIFKSTLALWYPKLNLNSNNFPSYETGFDNNSNSENTSSENFNKSVNLNLEWDFIDFSRNPNIKIARLNLEKAELTYKIKYRELYTELLEIFLQYKSSLEQIKIAEQAIAISQIAYKDANDRFKGGIGNKLEVLEAETQLRKDQQFLAKTFGDTQKNKNLLLVKLNLKGKDFVLDNSNLGFAGLWSSSINKSINEAIKNREEFKNLKLDQLINKNDISLKTASKKPKFTIYNTYSISSVKGESGVINPDSSKSKDSEENTIGMKFNWTLFDGGNTKQNFKSLKEKEKELKIDYKVKEELITNDIKNKFIDLNVALKNIISSYQQINSAQEALDLASMRLKAGVTNQRELLSNLSDLTESKSSYIKAVTNYNINIEKIKLNTGLNSIQKCVEDSNNSEKNNSIEIYKNINFELLKEICEKNVLQKL